MGEYDTSEYPWLIKRGHATGAIMENITTQELAIRAAIPSAVPGTGSIPPVNTLLCKDSSATTPTYEKLDLDSSLSISTVGGVKTLSSTGGSGSTFINGSNSTLDWFSPDGGASVRLRQLVGGVMIDSGWEVDVQTVTPPGGADKIVAMYVDGTSLMPVVVYDDGLGGVPTIPSNALQIRNIYVSASTGNFEVVYDDGT